MTIRIRRTILTQRTFNATYFMLAECGIAGGALLGTLVFNAKGGGVAYYRNDIQRKGFVPMHISDRELSRPI